MKYCIMKDSESLFSCIYCIFYAMMTSSYSWWSGWRLSEVLYWSVLSAFFCEKSWKVYCREIEILPLQTKPRTNAEMKWPRSRGSVSFQPILQFGRQNQPKLASVIFCQHTYYVSNFLLVRIRSCFIQRHARTLLYSYRLWLLWLRSVAPKLGL